MTYELRRLRLHGMIARQAGTDRHGVMDLLGRDYWGVATTAPVTKTSAEYDSTTSPLLGFVVAE
jgi:hypothetical protein